MSLKAVIIEDEKLTAERLENLIVEHTDLEVVKKLYSVKSAIDWLGLGEVSDVIFLDIQLGDGTGFDILQEISYWPHIIFTTAFDQYVLEAFKYNSIDYLLKPIKPTDLIAAVKKLNRVKESSTNKELLDTLNKRLFKKYKKKFLIKTGLKYKSVSVDQISCFYSEESCSYIWVDQKSLILDQSLDDLEKVLDPEKFYRVNRHLIVNIDSISGIDTYFNSRLLVEINPSFKEDIIVSRDRVKDFKSWMDE